MGGEVVEKRFDSSGMDVAAERAALSFPSSGSALDVVVWWGANYLKAGHKRLGRVLVEKAKVLKAAGAGAGAGAGVVEPVESTVQAVQSV